MPVYQVDAFSARPFRGNPAAVCPLPGEASAEWMQAVAAEMNLSETAFPVPDGPDFRLRWFTPTTEVDLCGHATLASAHTLWESGRLAADRPARFHTRSGLLTAVREGDWIVLDFPALPVSATEAPPGLAGALGAEPTFVGRNRMDLLVELPHAAGVRGLTPDLRALAQFDVRGVIVTAAGDGEGVDFVSRFFAPRAGVDEDPVTGSAHCALGPYWGGKLGRNTLLGQQVSARGGEIRVTVDGERVRLGGQAVTVFEGTLR